MTTLFQVGAGSGGMPVLDMLSRDPASDAASRWSSRTSTRPHNVERHLFPLSDVGRLKAELARDWLRHAGPISRSAFSPGI